MQLNLSSGNMILTISAHRHSAVPKKLNITLTKTVDVRCLYK